MLKVCAALILLWAQGIQANGKVSIITPVHNGGQFIRAYMEDITRLSDFGEYELIIVDANSTDDTESVILQYMPKHPNIRYQRIGDDIGYYSAINRGINMASGDYITVASVDDRRNPEFIKAQVAALEAEPGVDVIYANYLYTYAPNETFERNSYRWVVEPDNFSPQGMSRNLPGPFALWRKSFHEKYGYFDESMKCAANWKLWNHAVSRGAQFKKIDGTAGLYYFNPNGLTTTEEPVLAAVRGAENQAVKDEFVQMWRTGNVKPLIATGGDIRFVVIVPSYKNAQWYARNLQSIFDQKYQNYRVIYIDDMSPDGTADLVEQYVRLAGQEHRFTLVRNVERSGALHNLYHAIHSCDPHEVMVMLDGDDWFEDDAVLSYLHEVYSDPDVWLTYGQFKYWYGDDSKTEMGWARHVGDITIMRNAFRDETYVTTALRTCYAGLFQRIAKEDLFYEGAFYPMGWDLALMFPMLEMAGTHSKFISKVLYVYNVATQINDHKVNREFQLFLGRYVRDLTRYGRLESPFKPNKKVAVWPGLWGNIFDLTDTRSNRDDCLQPLNQLKQVMQRSGVEMFQANSLENLDSADYIVCFDVPVEQLAHLARYPKEKLILFMWEPASTFPANFDQQNHQYFSKIFTWDDRLVDNKTYFKFYYPMKHQMIDGPVDFDAKKLVTLIACNKHSRHPDELYSARRDIIDYFEAYHSEDFEFYGRGWNTVYQTYKGPVSRKVDVLKNYKFCICYENIKNTPGYVTEKILDCFWAGCVPVYWGAPNIANTIPKGCYIAREDFESYDQLYEFMATMNRETYERYMQNIQAFLSTSSSHKFSPEYFIEIWRELFV